MGYVRILMDVNLGPRLRRLLIPVPKIDSYNVDGISVTNSAVNIGDDCFSPKPNTSNIYVENLWCAYSPEHTS